MVFVGGGRALEMSSEQISAIVIDPDVDEAGLESTSYLLLDFLKSFALRSLWRVLSREMIELGDMTTASTSKNTATERNGNCRRAPIRTGCPLVTAVFLIEK